MEKQTKDKNVLKLRKSACGSCDWSYVLWKRAEPGKEPTEIKLMGCELEHKDNYCTQYGCWDWKEKKVLWMKPRMK